MLNLFHRSAETRSPLREPPLPQAGDGLHNEIHGRLFDVLMWLAIPGLFLALALTEWVHILFNVPPIPWLYTVLFLLTATFCGGKAWKIWRGLNPLILGLRGERSVGQALDTLRSRGYYVFHDLQQGDCKIDHMLVGPAGVFSIESKTHSKPSDHDAQILYDGRHISIDGHQPDHDPIAQAQANRRCVQQILLEQTGQEVAVKPVVLYPGWFVKPTVRNPEVYVANELWFLKSFDYEHSVRTLEETQIKLIVAALARCAREHG
jgi:hypothetical protein